MTLQQFLSLNNNVRLGCSFLIQTGKDILKLPYNKSIYICQSYKSSNALNYYDVSSYCITQKPFSDQ